MLLGRIRRASLASASVGIALVWICAVAPRAGASEASDANELGIERADAGDLAGAVEAWTRAAALAQTSGDPALRARALANLGRAFVEQGETARAATLLGEAQAVAIAQTGADSSETLISVGRSQALLAQRGGDRAALLAAAQRALAAGLERAQGAGDARGIALAEGRLAEVYADAGRSADAIALARRAVFAAQEARADELVALWLGDLGRWLARAGEIEPATDALRRAVRATEVVRAAPGGAAPALRAELEPVHLALVDLLLRRAATTEDANARAALLGEAREAAEAGKAAELRDYFHDECVDAARARARSLEEVSRSAAVLYPILLPDRTELLVSLPGAGTTAPRLERFGVAATGAEVAAEARTLRRLLEKRTTRQYLVPARRLYDLLVRPIEAALAASGATTLVWVPDGALRAIPLAALHDGERFVIERIAVATTPGLSLTDPRPIARSKLRALLSGLSKSREGSAPLAYARTEVETLHEMLGGEQLLDERFEAQRFERALAEEPFDVVHVASHGEFRADASQSYLLAWDGKVSMDALGKAIGALPFREDPLELLTLSACETAQGDDRAALGLAGAAVRTGARSVLGTLWQVQDEAASRLIVEFYRDLRKDETSRAEALRQAQTALLQDPRMRHPAFWAAFVLIGSWL